MLRNHEILFQGLMCYRIAGKVQRKLFLMRKLILKLTRYSWCITSKTLGHLPFPTVCVCVCVCVCVGRETINIFLLSHKCKTNSLSSVWKCSNSREIIQSKLFILQF